MPKTNKIGKVLGISFIAVITLALLVVTGFNLYQLITYNQFYSMADKDMLIPGLWDGVVPQGFEYDEETDTFYMSGYMKDGGSSRIYSFDKDGGNVRYAMMTNEDSTPDACHAGGFAIWNDYAFLAADTDVNIYLKSDINSALEQNGGTFSPIYTLEVPLIPAFCYVSDDGYLYIGEFYSAGDYETDPSHYIKTECGDEHRAIMAVYKLSENSENGIESEVPIAIYSITDRAQGICITDSGDFCVITSLGLSESHAIIYNAPTVTENATFEVTVNGETHDIPLYCLDSDYLIEDVAMHPMAEEPVYKDGKIYVMFESASNKYLFGKISGGTHVYSFPQK